MRLGLIGTGKQGQRYLLEKNGGRHIKVSGSRRIPLDDVDGVIIATHPAGHKELALECIAAGKAVLIEKPLALNLADCEEILDAAERAKVPCEVAHTHLWASSWSPSLWFANGAEVDASVCYATHDRDYSPWLDWASHLYALAFDAMQHGASAIHDVTVNQGDRCVLQVTSHVNGVGYEGDPNETPTPMHHMTKDFVRFCSRRVAGYWSNRIAFNRRVYRALFAEE